MKLNGTHYDGDKLRALANRDTPAAVVAEAILRASEGGEQATVTADARTAATGN